MQRPAEAVVAAPPAGPLLTAQGLACRVERRTLWRGLNLDMGAGDRVAIVGPSGSGKTLLLRTLAGLQPLAQGAIRFRGRPLARWRMPDYRAQVVYLPQRPALPEGRVEAVLRAPFRLRAHRDKHYPAAAVRDYLQALGIEEGFLDRNSENLSGGEGQIVALLRALLVEPAILLLDEPTASLDDDHVRRIEALVDGWLKRGSGRACVWTSHDRAQVERVSDRTLTLQAGA